LSSGLCTENRSFLWVICDLLDVHKPVFFPSLFTLEARSTHQVCTLALHCVTEFVQGDGHSQPWPHIKPWQLLKLLLLLSQRLKLPMCA